MSFELRAVDQAEAEAFHRLTWQAFGAIPDDDELARSVERFEPEFAIAVYDQGRIVATAGAYPLEMTLPAGRGRSPATLPTSIHGGAF